MATTTSELDQTLNETEIGAFIVRNKGLVISFIIGALIGVIGYGVYTYQKSKSGEKDSNLIFAFASTELKSLQDKKMQAGTFIEKFNGLKDQVGFYPGMAPLALQAADELIKQEKREEAVEVLTYAASEFGSQPYLTFPIYSRLAVAHEDLGNNAEALKALQKLNASPVKVLEAKTYLDLGRLYMATGNEQKARDSFQYVIDKFANEKDFTNLAKLYLARMESK